MSMNHLHSPIFVTGIERSGSSIVAKIIGSCGAFVGNVTEMQENKKIKELVDWFYQDNNIDHRGQYPLPVIPELKIPHNWVELVNDIILTEGYTGNQSWMYKSSRLTQVWPVWNYAYPNAKWIIVRRRTGDIIHSCLNTGFMTAYNNVEFQKEIEVNSAQEGWLWWVHEHEKLFVQMIEKGLDCKVVWPERMVNGDFQQVHEMLDWVGLKWSSKILSLVEPLLKSNLKERSV